MSNKSIMYVADSMLTRRRVCAAAVAPRAPRDLPAVSNRASVTMVNPCRANIPIGAMASRRRNKKGDRSGWWEKRRVSQR